MDTERKQVGIELADVANAIEREMYPAIVAYCRTATGTEPTEEQLATLATLAVCIMRQRCVWRAIVSGADGGRLGCLVRTAESLEAERIRDDVARGLDEQSAAAGGAN